MAQEIKALLYYKMTPLTDVNLLAEGMHAFCSHYNILGRILIGEEGLNGACAGPAESIEEYKKYVWSIPGLEDVWFKEHTVTKMPFHKLAVKPRKEIVSLGVEGVDGSKATGHITPEEFNAMYADAKKDEAGHLAKDSDLLIIDMRNHIEYRVGHFKDAVSPNTKVFSELPLVMDKFEDYKDKKVVMYCTGGIRCEKASEYFRQQGFKNVFHIKGGIYNYNNQFPNGLWEGDCFVFDDRMQIAFHEGEELAPGKVETTQGKAHKKILTNCDFCGEKCNRVVNDERKANRTLMVVCESCDKEHDISRIRYGEERKSLDSSSS